MLLACRASRKRRPRTYRNVLAPPRVKLRQRLTFGEFRASRTSARERTKISNSRGSPWHRPPPGTSGLEREVLPLPYLSIAALRPKGPLAPAGLEVVVLSCQPMFGPRRASREVRVWRARAVALPRRPAWARMCRSRSSFIVAVPLRAAFSVNAEGGREPASSSKLRFEARPRSSCASGHPDLRRI